MIVLIDNRDSFVWNLAEYASKYTRVKVLPNTASVKEVEAMNPQGIIISPGPGVPWERRYAGNAPRIIESMDIPILGVCLGHQIIVHVFGGRVEKVVPRHGKKSIIRHDGKGVFKRVKNPFEAGRYHSLAVTEIPKEFEISAISLDDRIIMGIRHKKLPIIGLQFHPESVLTEYREGVGMRIIKNFVAFAEGNECL
ncbi:MAG: aminodeoxychorismate/anthranilate synthase component II [Thermoplasmata archaeon]|nr:aminodeoxychorismate/anthranilate synthase component II [Thermoplasmata archaeon]